MTMNVIGALSGENQLTSQIWTVLSENLINEVHPWIVAEAFAAGENLEQNVGQTIEWHKFAPLQDVTTDLKENEHPVGTALQITVVQSEPLEYGDLVEFSGRLLQTAPDPLARKTQSLQGQQIAKSRDTMLQTTVVDTGTNVTYAGTATARNQVAAGDLPAATDLDAVIANLQRRGVPYVRSFVQPSTGVGTTTGLPAYVSIISVDALQLFKDLTDWKDVDSYQQGNALLPNEVGMYRNIRFCLSSTGYVFAGAGAASIDVHAVSVFGQDAYGTSSIMGRGPRAIGKALDSPDSGDPLGRIAWLGWKMDYGHVLLDQDKIERYEFAIA